MKINARSALFIGFFVVLCLFAFISGGVNFSDNIVALQTQDGRMLFGQLKGTTLCGYYEMITTYTPSSSAKRSIIRGSQMYGGDRCMTIREQIQWTEPLVSTTDLYKRIILEAH